jgi:hypothetical protein
MGVISLKTMIYTLRRGEKQIDFTLNELKEAVSDGWVEHTEYVTINIVGDFEVKDLMVKDVL